MLTGDYHQHDIKVVRSGASDYSAVYSTGDPRPLHQIMSSGLTDSTAVPGRSCAELERDEYGTRANGACAVWGGPAFGFVDVDWERDTMSLRIRSATGGEDHSSISFSLSECGA